MEGMEARPERRANAEKGEGAININGDAHRVSYPTITSLPYYPSLPPLTQHILDFTAEAPLLLLLGVSYNWGLTREQKELPSNGSDGIHRRTA